MGSEARAVRSAEAERAQPRPWIDFREGLSRPSGPALALALAVPLAGFLACALAITPEAFVRLHPFFAAEPKDSDVFLSARALGLASESVSDQPSIVILGGSSLMSVVDPDRLEGAVEAATDAPARAVSLMNLGQSMLDTICLTDVVPAQLSGVIVVGTSLVEISRGLGAPGPDDPPLGSRFAFDSPTRDEHARSLGLEEPLRTGNFFWDHRSFFLPRLGALARNLLWRGPVEQKPRPWQELEGQQPLAERQVMGERLRRLAELGYPARSEESLRLLGERLDRLRARGLRILLLEAPLAPLIVEEFLGRGFLEEHRRRMRSFAAERGFEYLDLAPDAGLTDADFFDHTHVFRAAAQQRFTDCLAGVVATRLGTAGEEVGG